jgi:DNA mismatch endonuclease (patch repair protein)
MTDVLTPQQRSFNMSHIRGRDTGPEMRVRKLLHAAGLRYRLHGKHLPGKPDLVFAGPKAVVFVQGCFWHMHHCKYGKPVPATNVDFWAEKRRGNVERDVKNRDALERSGWRVFEIWECETRDEEKLNAQVQSVIDYVHAARKRYVRAALSTSS